VAANKEARKPEKAIDGDDDSYMKNTCSAQKWVIIELSQVSPTPLAAVKTPLKRYKTFIRYHEGTINPRAFIRPQRAVLPLGLCLRVGHRLCLTPCAGHHLCLPLWANICLRVWWVHPLLRWNKMAKHDAEQEGWAA